MSWTLGLHHLYYLHPIRFLFASKITINARTSHSEYNSFVEFVSLSMQVCLFHPQINRDENTLPSPRVSFITLPAA